MKDVKEITKSLEENLKKVFASSEYLSYLKTMSKFHNYSYNNCLLILSQMPNASLVAGYKAWQNKFKRNVKKGAKAIYILAPMPRTIKKVNEETGEEEEHKYNAYRAVAVFDVSQTDGEELPTLKKAQALTGEVSEFSCMMDALKSMSSVPVKMADDCDGANGYCSPTEIVILDNMSEKQTIKTMIHELAHHLLGHASGSKEDRTTKEVQAESVAYIVSQYFGLDTEEYSFPYITGWASEKDTKTLGRILASVQKVADKIINGCEKSFEAVSKTA